MLFPTAIVKVKSSTGTIHSLRALLDQCSDSSFIKSSVAKSLGLEVSPAHPVDVTGLDENVTVLSADSSAEFQMLVDESEIINVHATIAPNLIGVIPIDAVKWSAEIFKDIKLADPTLFTPGTIDIMLGGQVYAKVLLDGLMKSCGYVAQNTQLGWIVTGCEAEYDSEVKSSSKCRSQGK